MATVFDESAFDRATDSFIRFLIAEQGEAVVNFRGDETLRARIEELAHKSAEGDLTEEEQAEYRGYVKANNFIAVMQTRARKMLAEPPC
ncbi:MAG: hypothetical protein WD229_05295 [Pirellulales bacterium]